MSNEQIMQYAPFIAIGVFVLMAIIIIPLVLRSTRKKRNQSEQFFPVLALETGLQINHDHLEGNYKGFKIHFQYKMGTNMIAAYKTIATGNSNAYGKNAIFPTVHATITLDQPVGGVALYETLGILSHTNQKIYDIIQGKGSEYPKLDLDATALKGGHQVYGSDSAAAQRLLSSSELKNLLSSWKYTDIKSDGNTVKLTLDNTSATSTIGISKLYTHEFAIQAMDIAVAAAKAIKGN
jgi:hypothetical protein